MFKKITTKFKESLPKLSKYAFYILLVLLIITIIKNVSQLKGIENKIKEKEANLQRLEAENKDLEKKLAEVQSDDYIEKQIRDKLGMAKPGEIVVVLPDESVLRAMAPKDEEEAVTLPDPNWRRWIQIFGF